MEKESRAEQLERLVYGFSYGGVRIDLLRLCFPFFKGVTFYGSDTGGMVCHVELTNSEVPVAQMENLVRALELLTRTTFSLRSMNPGGNYGCGFLVYDVVDGVPWPEYDALNDSNNTYCGDNTPKSVYKGGPI